MPDFGATFDPAYAYGVLALERGIVCFLDLDHMFAGADMGLEVA
jgi:purine-binding chemotaxis protein CheW